MWGVIVLSGWLCGVVWCSVVVLSGWLCGVVWLCVAWWTQDKNNATIYSESKRRKMDSSMKVSFHGQLTPPTST